MKAMSEDTAQDEQREVAQRSERLRQAVNQAGGQTAVGRKAKMATTTINNYLAGRDMKAAALVALAEACDVSIEWLATGAGPMKASEPSQRDNGAAFFGEALHEPANFMAFCVLLSSCQEFHTRVGLKPTLYEVFEWIGPLYGKARRLPDGQIQFKSPERPA